MIILTMKKLGSILTLCMLYFLCISTTFAELIPVNSNTTTGTTAQSQRSLNNSAKNTYTKTSSGKLPMPGRQHYDQAIAQNKIANHLNVNTKASAQDIIRSLFWDDGKVSKFIITLNVIIGAVGVLWIIMAALGMIFNSGDAEAFGKGRDKIMWIAIGLGLISAAEYMAFNIFNPEKNLIGDSRISEAFYNKMMQIKMYLQYLAAGAILYSFTRAGYYFIMQPEQEETITQEKKFILHFIIGVAFIVLSEVVIRGIIFANKNNGANGGSGGEGTFVNPKQITVEIVGIINYALTFIVAAAVIMMVLASIYYIMSFGDEERSGDAKKIIIGCVVALMIAFSAFTIMRFLL